MDILKNINLLQQNDFKPEVISLMGYKLGDSLNGTHLQMKDKEPDYYGWLNVNDTVAFRVTKNTEAKILEFQIKAPGLSDFYVNRMQDIEKVFGKARADEERNNVKNYFYPERKMVVSYDTFNSRLKSVYIGKNFITMSGFRVKDFLYQFIKFRSIIPYQHLDSIELIDYQANKLRWLQLKALMKAFDLGESLKEFDHGSGIINKLSLSELEPVIKKLEEFAQTDELASSIYQRNKKRYKEDYIEIIKFELPILFRVFISFIEKLESFYNENKGWLEAGSITVLYSINKTSEIQKGIDDEKVQEIRDLLCYLMDPKDRIFTKDEMITLFGYPKEDADEYEKWY